ncbi:hypothetical protein BZL30_7014 [Mycobacterium kansasii]|uniref:Uncharacterized protein n=1 Tax=Mycobacterium kansasii TaxID=1768 RepID=A0A1V3WRZ0_MYCKA|nr:hypothetical protein BZL30_7014 [Mycobacterium kansasii]OOK69729.1 hypothetical protein BZL29_6170 [Mycobacterium kansasii]
MVTRTLLVEPAGNISFGRCRMTADAVLTDLPGYMCTCVHGASVL